MFSLKTQLAKSATTCSAVSASRVRLFTTSQRCFSDHDHHDHHEELAPEEKLADNPLYIGTLAALIVGAAGIGFDTYYKKLYGKSYFGQWIHPTPSEEVISENKEYQELTMKDAQFYEVMYAQPVKSVFRDLEVVQPIRRGSSFNREPGSSLDIDSLSPRREIKKSLFDWKENEANVYIYLFYLLSQISSIYWLNVFWLFILHDTANTVQYTSQPKQFIG